MVFPAPFEVPNGGKGVDKKSKWKDCAWKDTVGSSEDTRTSCCQRFCWPEPASRGSEGRRTVHDLVLEWDGAKVSSEAEPVSRASAETMSAPRISSEQAVPASRLHMLVRVACSEGLEQAMQDSVLQGQCALSLNDCIQHDLAQQENPSEGVCHGRSLLTFEGLPAVLTADEGDLTLYVDYTLELRSLEAPPPASQLPGSQR